MKMAATSPIFSSFFVLVFLSFSWGASLDSPQPFIQCLTRYSKDSESITKIIYTPTNSSFTSILQLTLQNLRFATQQITRKPLVIVTPVDESQIQTVIYCCRRNGMALRIRGGGHDFEGLSYRAEVPFVMLDMINFRSVNIDIKSENAWVQAGATLGELYYRIAEKSEILGFPAGLVSTVGVSGFISGGGYGMMKRKYGLAADNTFDARLIDVNGRILNRKSMGEDLFWAIRGGGVSSFGVVLSWKIKLVPVPKIVTIFGVIRTLEQNGSKLFQKWQSIAPNEFPTDLDVRCVVDTILSNSSTREDKKTVRFFFQSLFLGRIDDLLPIMQKNFPELGLVREDCSEVSWIQSVLFFPILQHEPNEDILINRTYLPKFSSKSKSDFVTEPISEEGIRGIWEIMLEAEPYTTNLLFTPYGGRMSEISESEIPFPHRAGTLYMLYMSVFLNGEGKHEMNWIRSLHSYLGPYVTKFPRASYLNYPDLDLGVNNPQGSTSYAQASVWGKSYFKNNFERLVVVKSMVDPDNFFRHEQSIPPFSNKDGRCEVVYFGDGPRIE